MFDIGFWELSIIGVVALIVIGPERLPSVAKTVGLWVGQMKRFVGSMKMEIDKELKAEELKKILQKQADSAGIYEIIEEGKSALDEVKNDLDAAENSIQSELNSPVMEEAFDPEEVVPEPAISDKTKTTDNSQ
jgi:sec-independent protein translocase protein TatB